MRVLLFCNKGFEMMEFAPFVDVFGWAKNDFGCNIEVITCGFTRTVHSTFGIPVIVDKTIDEVNVGDYDALAIPGGFEEYGFYEEAFDQRFLDLIAEFDKCGKYIASICVGALPMGKSGVLTGRKATTYHLSGGHRQRQLAEFGVDVIPDQRIVVDKNIITSFCPETAAGVAYKLLAFLAGEEKAREVAAAMGYDTMLFEWGVCNGKYNSIFTYSNGDYVPDWHRYGNTCIIFQYQEETSNSFNHIFDCIHTADLYSVMVHCWDLDFTMHADNCFDI